VLAERADFLTQTVLSTDAPEVRLCLFRSGRSSVAAR